MFICARHFAGVFVNNIVKGRKLGIIFIMLRQCKCSEDNMHVPSIAKLHST